MSPRVRSILTAAASEHGMTLEQLREPSRRRPIAYARFDAMSRLRALHHAPGRPVLSYPQIAELVGLKDHTSAMHGVRKGDELYGPRPPVFPIHDTEETRL